MTLSNALHRPHLVAGLHALADFLENHPEVPAPFTIDAVVFAATGTDAAMRAEVDRVAAWIGSPIEHEVRAGHYRTVCEFGPVQYRMVAVLADARTRYDAWLSYWGAINPDHTSEETKSQQDEGR